MSVRAVNSPTRFVVPDDWPARAALLRLRILAAAGLRPMPGRGPVRAVVARTLEREGYRVENLWFEAGRGSRVAGNLYVPAGRGPFPAVLHPHGHWEKGRAADDTDGSSQAFCVSLARAGWVAFAWDMIGYNDSRWLPHDFSDRRAARLGVTLLGLQLWNSLRAVDFVAAHPAVDASRLAIAGASGGATQAMLAGAVDGRLRASALVCMISASMQGGCVCENAPGLRLDTDNVELAALFAPRPLLLVSATGDWTARTPRVEYPAIRRVYERLGAPERVANAHFRLPHNFLPESREAVYAWFARHLGGPAVRESTFRPERVADLLARPPRKRGSLRELLAEARSRARLDVEALRVVSGIDVPGRAPRIRDRRRAYARLVRRFRKQLLRWSGRGPRVRIALDEYFDCYNRTDDAERIQAIVARLARKKGRIVLRARGRAAAWARAAALFVRVDELDARGPSEVDLPCVDLYWPNRRS